MKKVEANRYPHSATLFKFCKEALEIRYDGNVKVIDQDVGAILGYDPADCSHWKKGKKNIRALATLKSIADHLNVDERLLIDIASGQVDLDEALFEYRGYGRFALADQSLDNLKKLYLRNAEQWENDASEFNRIEENFFIDRSKIVGLVNEIVSSAKISTAPVAIETILAHHADLSLVADSNMEIPVLLEEPNNDNTGYVIKYRGTELKPFTRFLVVRSLFFYFLKTSRYEQIAKILQQPVEVQEISANLFAGMILIPTSILSEETRNIDGSFDFVAQLANKFFVSKALMNQRLQDYFKNKN
jgi:hypothetical protein